MIFWCTGGRGRGFRARNRARHRTATIQEMSFDYLIVSIALKLANICYIEVLRESGKTSKIRGKKSEKNNFFFMYMTWAGERLYTRKSRPRPSSSHEN